MPTQSFTPVLSGLLQRKCACGGLRGLSGDCGGCKGKKLQPATRSSEPKTDVMPPIVHEVLHSPGQPLDEATRAFFEPRFGHDFSQVRVHTDTGAAKSARAVNALAYTVGKHVVFGDGEFAPGTTEGNSLLAHELTHVIQQRFSTSLNTHSVNQLDDDAKELEAMRMADTVQSRALIHDLPLIESHVTKALVQRNGDGKERSRESKPRNAPRGTRPIDEHGLDKEDVHKIKDGVGAGPRDWVGITPEGEVITTDGEGNAENHGPASDYLREAHPEVPDWVWPLLIVVGIIVVAGIIACFATGVCEFAAVVAGLGYATALLIISLLKKAGIKDSGSEGMAAVESQSEASEEIG